MLQETPALHTPLVLIASGDEWLARSLESMLTPNGIAVVKAMTGLTPKVMAEDIGVPFHPGAAKYYKEAGINVATN